MTEEQDTGPAQAAVMAAAGVGCMIAPAVAVVPEPPTCRGNTCPGLAGSWSGNGRSLPPPVLEGRGFPRLPGGLVRECLASWARWMKPPMCRTTASLQRIPRWS